MMNDVLWYDRSVSKLLLSINLSDVDDEDDDITIVSVDWVFFRFLLLVEEDYVKQNPSYSSKEVK